MFGLENAQSLLGLALILGLCWAISENRRRFPWKLALGAIAVQALLVLALFGLPAIRAGLLGVGQAVDGLAASTQAGVAFVFGFLAGTPGQPYQLVDPNAQVFVFAFRVLPVIQTRIFQCQSSAASAQTTRITGSTRKAKTNSEPGLVSS